MFTHPDLIESRPGSTTNADDDTGPSCDQKPLATTRPG